MKKGFLFAAVLLVAISFTNSASAQTVKIGYFDEQKVIALFPGIQEKLDTVLQSYAKDTLQDEYNYTLKSYQVKDSIYRKDSLELAKRPKALQLSTDELNQLKYKLINWQQYQQEAMQQKQEQLLLPYRQKIFAALSEVIAENKYTWVLNESTLSPYFQHSIADNLAIRTAIKLKLPLPKDVEEAFRVATGGAPAKAAAPGAAKPAAPAKKP
jgi:Skp family chaperone for outer membrane proteins